MKDFREHARVWCWPHLVVVASGRQVLVVGGPLEAAHLLPVALQPPLGGGRSPDVPLQDDTVAAP